ncbi:sugar transferase [Patescibacteria group bacterium]|nr:sugar transferase [Patescibacteria group bacterium]
MIDNKRIFDIILSIIGLIFFIPIFVFIYPFFVLLIGCPVIFKQKRIGKDKKIFTIYKLRTMKRGASSQQDKLKKLNISPYPMFKIKNDPRFTIIGKTLSNFGIDEIPQIINILKGEMSLVGPRPLPVNEANSLPSSWDFRYKVRPGIISKWALSPNRYQSLNEWRKLEKNEINDLIVRNESKLNWSLKNDLSLIFNTFYKIIIKQLLKGDY